MSEDVYLQLYRELNASRFDSSEANDAIEQLGAPARTIRGLARARRHAWASARADLRAAALAPDVAPLVELVAGVGLHIARDYDFALTTLASAATRGKPGIAKQARLYALRFASALGWTREAHDLQIALGSTPDPEPEPASANELESIATRVRHDLLHGHTEQAAARLQALRPEQRERLPAERAALALIRNDAAEAMVRTTHHRDDPRLLYLRARALMLQDEHAEAGELLERARVRLPRSVTIVLALALARHREAPDTFGEGLERRFDDLLDWAPALLSDAAAALDLTLWTDQGVLSDRADKVAILERADQLLTREAELVHPSYRYPSRTGQLRLRDLPPAPLRGPAPLALLHADDRKLIDHIDGVLVRALGISPPRPDVADAHRPVHTHAHAPWQPRTLSPAAIEQFLIDGFLIVPRAFDPELARTWREDANRRIQAEPERWVRGYDPSDQARSLRNYSPDDPSTWTWGRVDLDGPETVVIEEFAPTAWATICDLLGGPDRIKTRTWTNYLIINFCADAELGFDTPAPDWSSWHIDDPSPMTRLDRIANGLVGIALFDRLLPRSGNTWIAPDSVGRVARELAAHPEGVDFVANRGNRITTECERFHEVVGEAGDVLLMHPLMMHSSSPNRSGRIRWMGNPMIYLHEPLDPFRPVAELSLVELAIHRAIS